MDVQNAMSHVCHAGTWSYNMVSFGAKNDNWHWFDINNYFSDLIVVLQTVLIIFMKVVSILQVAIA